MADRDTTLNIDLGEQVLFEKVTMEEGLSRPFVITLDLISPLTELDLLPHLGKPAAIAHSQDGELQRYFHGMLTEGEFLKESQDGFHYRLTLRPWTYWLEQNSDFAIHQEIDTVEIIKRTLKKTESSDVDWGSLSGKYEARDYCVQYGESDFAFICRLMEDEGIYYYFRHEKEKHVLVFCDGPSSHKNGEPSELEYNPMTVSVFNLDSSIRGTADMDYFLQSWTQKVATRGEGKIVLRDFNFEEPETPLEATYEGKKTHPQDTVRLFQYPAGYSDNAEGAKLGEKQLAALRSERVTFSGTSQASGISVGYKLGVHKHPNDKLNGQFLITRTFHSITSEKYRSGEQEAKEPYNVAFDAIVATTAFYPPSETEKPIVHGLETAIISGPNNEEIYTDEYGRVKVRFHWDQARNGGEESTCWMRVSQTGGLGNIIMPRVGHEVLVDFLSGDPDRPIVVGRVFNKSNMPIYDLPDNKTRALWRTKSYGQTGSLAGAKGLDTGDPGCNELRFEDLGGKEEVFLHAQKDMNTRVRHKETHHVGLDQDIDIGGNRTELVEGSDTITIQQGRKTKINASDELTVATTLDIKANSSITITCGGSKITMTPGGITIEAVKIDVKAQAMLNAEGTMSTVKGSAMLTLQGGLVKIN